MTEQGPIMTRLAEGQQLAVTGDREGARAVFAELWDEVGADGDPLHVVSLAHYTADVQDDPADELEWDLRALRAADELTDERAQRHHSSLHVRDFHPSLHLNLAADYAKLEQYEVADEYLTKAEEVGPELPEGEYGDGIRAAITRLRAELTTRTSDTRR